LQRPVAPIQPEERGLAARAQAWLHRLLERPEQKGLAPSLPEPLHESQVEPVLRAFVAVIIRDPALQDFALDRQVITHYVLSSPEAEFYLQFNDGAVTGDLGLPPGSAPESTVIRIQAGADTLDGMLVGRINAMRAAMTGKLVFDGDARLAMGIQRIQGDLCRLYTQARREVLRE
jgi:hypothetical protein